MIYRLRIHPSDPLVKKAKVSEELSKPRLLKLGLKTYSKWEHTCTDGNEGFIYILQLIIAEHDIGLTVAHSVQWIVEVEIFH